VHCGHAKRDGKNQDQAGTGLEGIIIIRKPGKMANRMDTFPH
jgi:hypothetical protein